MVDQKKVIFPKDIYQSLMQYGIKKANEPNPITEEKMIAGVFIGNITSSTIIVKNFELLSIDEGFFDEIAKIDIQKFGKHDYIIGWFHSNPGFSCYLSAVDIRTQYAFQYSNPDAFAVVFDPISKNEIYPPTKNIFNVFRLIRVYIMSDFCEVEYEIN